MRRKKDPQTPPVDPAKFWPVPGVDGEPYPPRVQEALDLVAKETKRLKIRECRHEGRFPSQVHPGWEGLHSRSYHVCACRDCGADRIACVPTLECDPRMRRTEIYGVPYERRTDPVVSRQIKRAYAQIPLGFDLPSDPGTKPGALEKALIRAMERDMREMDRDMERMRPRLEGQLRRSVSVNTEELDWERVKARNLARRSMQAKLPQVISDPDQAPDLSWVRTMDGRKRR